MAEEWCLGCYDLGFRGLHNPEWDWLHVRRKLAWCGLPETKAVSIACVACKERHVSIISPAKVATTAFFGHLLARPARSAVRPSKTAKRTSKWPERHIADV